MMRNRKNYLLLVALSIACCLFFASCAGKSQDAPSQEEQPQETAAQGLSGEEVYQKIEPSTVEIVAYGKNFTSQGSGFYIDQDGTVVTNFHVISKCTSASVITGDGGSYSVEKVLGYSKELDIAILATSRKNSIPLEMSTEPVNTGETVYALGSSIGLTGTFSEGIVSSSERELDGMTYIQITTPISHGNSGGPLVNKNGFVVGIVCAGFESGQNLNLALPILLLDEISTDKSLTMDEFYTESLDGTLKVAVENDFYPYSFEANGTFYGLHIDIAYCLAEELGWEIEFVPSDYKGMFSNLLADTCDIAFGIEGDYPINSNVKPLKPTRQYYNDFTAVVHSSNTHQEEIVAAFNQLLSDGTIKMLVRDYQEYIESRISRVDVRIMPFGSESSANDYLTILEHYDADEFFATWGKSNQFHSFELGEPSKYGKEVDDWLFAYNRRVNDADIIQSGQNYYVLYVSALE